MSIISYNDIIPKKVIIYNNEPHIVLSSWVFRKQQRKPVNQTKLRSIKTGKVLEISFHQTETVEEAEVDRKELTYIYRSRGEVWFHEAENPQKRIALSEEAVGDKIQYVKEKTNVIALEWREEIIGIEIPIKVELKVTEAPPAIKGNTATGGSKLVVLETGATVNTPLFINEGDVLRINTDTGEYVERVSKS